MLGQFLIWCNSRRVHVVSFYKLLVFFLIMTDGATWSWRLLWHLLEKLLYSLKYVMRASGKKCSIWYWYECSNCSTLAYSNILWITIAFILWHNTSHIKIKHMKCSESKTLLQFEFWIWLQSFKWKIRNKTYLRKC
jgi:hypothetical protein